jgi:maltooligosyltrehalose trehalohydrolase
MDATHTVHDESPVHLLAEVAEIVHLRGGFIIAEDDRNERTVLDPRDRKGWGFDAVWSDDFHHAMRVSQTGEREYFLSMFDGTAEEIARVLRRGWLYSGQFSKFHKRNRGTPADDFPPQSFVYCVSNHDQVGNRWQGTRLHTSIDPAGYRALSLFLCLAPYTPLLFMGQEWAASAPFHYFTDMSEELGKKIVEGRGREFVEVGFVDDPKELEQMSNPQAEKTFLESKLDWSEHKKSNHAHVLALYKAGLKLRRELFGSENPPRNHWQVEADENSVTIRYRLQQRRIAVHFRIKPGRETPVPKGAVVLSSNAPEFAGAMPALVSETVVIEEP